MALAEVLDEAGQAYTLEESIPVPEFQGLRPADILLKGWLAGKDTALDLTVVHGWQESQRRASRERCRAFLRRKEQDKHDKYDRACLAAGWEMRAMAFGTWGGMGPEGTQVLKRLINRAASWHEGDLKAACRDRLEITMGIALLKSVWKALYNKSLL
jgi:GrpB-like predicted nucleotidyltransferase (UPF0157 family)